MSVRKIGVLGSGAVGETLANGLLRHGYEVMRGSRDPAKLAAWKDAAGARAGTGTFAEAAVDACGTALDGKPVIDTCNALADAPPVNGVLQSFTGPNESLMERLQQRVPKAKFVKSFSCVGNSLMVDPDLGGVKPTMFLCGNDAGAKTEVQEILQKFGWEWEDLGGVEAARAIEPLAVLWCIPGFLRNDWSRAYKVLRK